MSKKRRIIFRADGNNQIGLGHVVRSLALVSMLRQEFECVFAIQAPGPELQQQIRKICHGLIILPVCATSENRFNHELDAYISAEEMVVLDGYHFNTAYQQSIKSKDCILVCIDDIHLYPFVADVVINHGTLQASQYEVPYYTKLLVGPKYALLRPPFLQHTDSKIKGEGVFLCFGGSDYHNLTLKLLKAVTGTGHVNHLEVVVGSAYAHMRELQDFVQRQAVGKSIRIHQDVTADELVYIMSTCNTAVVPASSIALECVSLGLQLICGYYAENQKGILHMLTMCGAAVDVGNFLELNSEQLNNVIVSLQENPLAGVTRERLFGDQNPAVNLLKKFKSLHLAKQLQIRRACISDMDLYYSWVNEPATRQNAVNTEALAYEDHVRWFSSKVNSAQSLLYLFSLGDVPVGQVRFDSDGGAYTIDYSVSPDHRGLGLGRAILGRAIAQLKIEVTSSPLWLKATVRTTNKASKKVFESMHFAATASVNIEDVIFDSFEIYL